MKRWKRRIRQRKLVKQREHARLRVANGIFAALHPQFAVPGQIMNISGGGLAFRYVASQPRSNQACKLGILLPDGSFCLDEVPFKTVWDCPIPYDFSFGAITFGLCGVQFEELSDDQKFCLEHFMRKYTVGEAALGAPVPVKVLGGVPEAVPVC